MKRKSVIFFVIYAQRFRRLDSLTDQTQGPKEGDQSSERPEVMTEKYMDG